MTTQSELLSGPFAGTRSPSSRRSQRRIGLTIAIAASLVIHAFLAVYLWTAKFAPHYHSYDADQVTQVTLLAPPPPPPPPPPPKAEKPHPKPPPRQTPPQTVHARPPKV